MSLSTETTTAEAFPPAVLGRGYTDAELVLIKTIWTDTKQVAQQKMQLCLHLYELKQEMDANDPSAGSGNNGQSRFWKAFEQGDLPEYVTNSRQRTTEWLSAAEFASSGELTGVPVNSLLALTPSTLCNLARISNPDALKIAEQHLKAHEFIGHDAAHYLAKKDLDDEVLTELRMWIADNGDKALVPSVIRKVEADVRFSQQPASTRTIDANQAERQAAAFESMMADVRQRAPEVDAQNRVNAVREELERPSREQRQELEGEIRKYNSKLNAAAAELDELLSYLKSIDRIQGTLFLDELRADSVNGLISVENDLDRIRSMGAQLMQIVELASSHTTASGINMTTLDIDQL